VAFRGQIIVVGIASRYELDVVGFEPRWGARVFRFMSAETGSEAHPASSTMDTRALFRWQGGRSVTLTPSPF
jgi:hypothetical protein